MKGDVFGNEQGWARVLADSITPGGHRLTTVEAALWRPGLAEQNTHRKLSRNSASSRAIPIEKMLDRFVEEHEHFPIKWPSEKPGMQGGAELEGDDLCDAQNLWGGLCDVVLEKVEQYVLAHEGKATRLHKSLLNRWLEIGLSQTQIISGTDWAGYLWQREHGAAEAHINAMAVAIGQALEDSTPTLLEPGQWHLPLFGPENGGHEDDWADARNLSNRWWLGYGDEVEIAKRVSSGRCARVSYLTHEGERDLIEDVSLYEKLADRREQPEDPPHASPLEHVATPWDDNCQDVELPNGKVMTNLPKVGNFIGWCQLRHLELAF